MALLFFLPFINSLQGTETKQILLQRSYSPGLAYVHTATVKTKSNQIKQM